MTSKELKQYQTLIKKVVSSMRAQRCSMLDDDDMTQIALMTLYEIQDDLSDKPDCFLSKVIKSRIIDEARRVDWRSRSVRQDAYKLISAERRLTVKLSRYPFDSEVAEEMGVSIEDVREMRIDTQAITSFDEFEWSDSFKSKDNYSDIELSDLFSRRLSKRDKQVMELHYIHDVRFADIADALDMTAARLSQINKDALNKLASSF